MTAGTRYGAQLKGELVPITQPGVNCAHRMANLREVDFEEGCIGAEDVPTLRFNARVVVHRIHPT